MGWLTHWEGAGQEFRQKETDPPQLIEVLKEAWGAYLAWPRGQDSGQAENKLRAKVTAFAEPKATAVGKASLIRQSINRRIRRRRASPTPPKPSPPKTTPR